MIVEWIMEVSAGFLEWFATLFPPVDLPEWVENPFFGLSWIVEAAAGWGAWVNIPFIASVALVVLGVYVTTILAKLFRVLIAHVPFIGGRG